MYVSLSPNSDTSGLQFDMNPAAWLTMRNRDLGGGLTWHHARPRLSDRHPGASTRRTCRLLICMCRFAGVSRRPMQQRLAVRAAPVTQSAERGQDARTSAEEAATDRPDGMG